MTMADEDRCRRVLGRARGCRQRQEAAPAQNGPWDFPCTGAVLLPAHVRFPPPQVVKPMASSLSFYCLSQGRSHSTSKKCYVLEEQGTYGTCSCALQAVPARSTHRVRWDMPDMEGNPPPFSS